MALLFRLVHCGLRQRQNDVHSGSLEHNVSRPGHRSKGEVSAKESNQRGTKWDSSEGHEIWNAICDRKRL
jgi:hypothetical protein